MNGWSNLQERQTVAVVDDRAAEEDKAIVGVGIDHNRREEEVGHRAGRGTAQVERHRRQGAGIGRPEVVPGAGIGRSDVVPGAGHSRSRAAADTGAGRVEAAMPGTVTALLGTADSAVGIRRGAARLGRPEEAAGRSRVVDHS